MRKKYIFWLLEQPNPIWFLIVDYQLKEQFITFYLHPHFRFDFQPFLSYDARAILNPKLRKSLKTLQLFTNRFVSSRWLRKYIVLWVYLLPFLSNSVLNSPEVTSQKFQNRFLRYYLTEYIRVWYRWKAFYHTCYLTLFKKPLDRNWNHWSVKTCFLYHVRTELRRVWYQTKCLKPLFMNTD